MCEHVLALPAADNACSLRVYLQISFKVDGMFLKAGGDAVRARIACASAVAKNPRDRETPISAAMQAFKNGGAANSNYADNEVFYTVSYAGELLLHRPLLCHCGCSLGHASCSMCSCYVGPRWINMESSMQNQKR